MAFMTELITHVTTGELFEVGLKVIEALVLLIGASIALKELLASRLEKSWEFTEKFDKEWESLEFKESRCEIARHLIESAAHKTPPNLFERHLQKHLYKILDFFEMLGMIHKAGGIKTKFAWSIWSDYLSAHGPHLLDAVNKNIRTEGDTSTKMYYEDFENLIKIFKKYNKRHKYYELDDLDAENEIRDNLHLSYRKIKPEDLDQVWEIERYKFDMGTTSLTQEEMVLYGKKYPQQMYVCESLTDGIVGYAFCTLLNNKITKLDLSLFSNEKATEIVSLSVSPNYRRLGIEKSLMDIVEERSHVFNAESLILVLPQSQKDEIELFKALDFHEHSELKDHYQPGAHGLIMKKDLINKIRK
jgi:ribosomal protein S18 acetylase RimI-like enzyme